MSYAEAKALVLVATGRVTDLAHDADGTVSAIVEGEHGRYRVIRTRTGVWCCPCLGWTYYSRCSHQLAVQLLLKADGAARQQADSNERLRKARADVG